MVINGAMPTQNPSVPRPVGQPGALSSGPGGDGFRPSAELQDPGQLGGSLLASGIAGAQYDSILKGQAQQLMVAASTGVGDVQGMADQLMKDYQKAKEMGAVLSPQTEELIQKALAMVQGGQQQNPAAADGGAGVPAVGGPQAGGGPTGGGGGAPTGGGGPSGTGGGTPSGAAPSSTNRNGNGTVDDTTSAENNGNTATPPPETPGAAEAGDEFNNVTQGTPNNCVATSVTKQMQHQWGDQAMQFEEQPDGTLKVTMRDGYTTTLTQDQIEQARGKSDYAGDNEAAREQAIRMNAAASARWADENNKSYGEGLDYINGRNMWPDQMAPYFGVQTQAVDPATGDGNGFYIAANHEHSTNVMETPRGGKFQDDHGEIPTDPNGGAHRWDNNIYSNGENTGPAEYGWILRDRNDTGATSNKVAKLSFKELKSSGYLDDLVQAHKATSGGGGRVQLASSNRSTTSSSLPGSGTSTLVSRPASGSATPSLSSTRPGSGSSSGGSSSGGSGSSGSGTSGGSATRTTSSKPASSSSSPSSGSGSSKKTTTKKTTKA